jgi:hypothetical protein
MIKPFWLTYKDFATFSIILVENPYKFKTQKNRFRGWLACGNMGIGLGAIKARFALV